jgi:aspartate ammonia-lyase
LILAKGLLTQEELDEQLLPENMIKPRKMKRLPHIR